MRKNTFPVTLIAILSTLVILAVTACSTDSTETIVPMGPQPVLYELSYDGVPKAEIKVTPGVGSIIAVTGSAAITPPRGEVSEYIINPEKGQPFLQEGSYCRIEVLENGQVAIAFMNTRWSVTEK